MTVHSATSISNAKTKKEASNWQYFSLLTAYSLEPCSDLNPRLLQKDFYLTLLLAKSESSFKFSDLTSNWHSFITVLRHVAFGAPRRLFPCGFHPGRLTSLCLFPSYDTIPFSNCICHIFAWALPDWCLPDQLFSAELDSMAFLLKTWSFCCKYFSWTLYKSINVHLFSWSCPCTNIKQSRWIIKQFLIRISINCLLGNWPYAWQK
jgi:hypothetical protein